MAHMRGLLAVALVFGCAKADTQHLITHDGNTGHDATVFRDAPADSGPASVTLSETADSTIAGGKSLACGNNTTGDEADNIWYRIFKMSDFGITNTLHVTNISFGIQESGGNPSVTVKLGSYSGAVGGTTVDTSKITPVTQQLVTIPPVANGTGEMVMTTTLVGDVPPGNFVVQIGVPDLSGTSKFVYIGATVGAETEPSYISSAACASAFGTSAPLTMQAAAQACSPPCTPGQIIINVTGTH
jgi:hypothetical protein